MTKIPAIEADDPRQVAAVLAELWGGAAEPAGAGSWAASAGDDICAAAFVHPRLRRREPAQRLAMGTLLDVGSVLRIAGREGWPATYRRRAGGFGVVDLWIERRQFVEVMTAELPPEHAAAARRPGWKRLLSSAARAA